MKITDIRTILVDCFRTNWAFVKVETDEGLSGVGEATLEYKEMALEGAVAHLKDALVGRNPLDIEAIYHDSYRDAYWRGGAVLMSALSAVEMALWDILGKAAHQPVCRLLGQYSDRVPSYASGGFYAPGKDLDGLRREIAGYLSRGYRDAKIKIGRTMDRPGAPLSYMANRDWAVTPEEDFRRVATAKELLGDGLLIVDTNASWDSYIALSRGRELARLGVEWLEEPIPFEDLEGYTRISRELPQLRIIGCETQQGADNFATMIRSDALDIAQPDAGWVGGISETLKIGAVAKAAGRKISLHCFGSSVLFAASLQVAAAMSNTERIESEENPNPLKTDLVRTPFETDEHMSFLVPQGEGLGIELDWDKVSDFTVEV